MVQESLTDSTDSKTSAKHTRVVYLIGSGLTNATAKRSAFRESFLLSDLCKDTILKLHEDDEIKADAVTGPLINWLVEITEKTTPSLEELVDLLHNSGITKCSRMAATLSERFGDVLCKRLIDLGKGGTENLAEIITEWHEIPDNGETLVGFITTNYDTLLEDALTSKGYDPDFGFGTPADKANAIPLLKLHGCISWAEGVPIERKQLADLGQQDQRLWIGPQRTKLGVTYPFNLIWGRARELLAEADTVRVIGASLWPSDWHIVQLLFQSSVIDTSGASKSIEVINHVHTCKRIRDDYQLLRIVPLYEIDEVVRYCRTDKGVQWSQSITAEDLAYAVERLKSVDDAAGFWLLARITMLLNNGRPINTDSGKLRQFLDSVPGGTNAL